MRTGTFICLLFLVPSLCFGQAATKTGSIYGKVLDEKISPMPGVGVLLESQLIPSQTATTGPSGGFRFANLPPGTYTVYFELQGFTKIEQENVKVSTGSEVQLEIIMKPSVAEEITVIGETHLLDSRKSGSSANYHREHLDEVPTARDPWSVLQQTPGIDSSRNDVTQQGVQSNFGARGSFMGSYNYDGLNITDAGGSSPTYYDFDAFEEIQISTGGNDASIGTGGVAINLVTKRAGNRWAANASFYFFDHQLQSHNTPEELVALGKTGSQRIDEIKDYGFDLGGPILKDKLFVWGAYRKNDIGLITLANLPDFTQLEIFNFKANFNWTSAQESQFGYFAGYKTKNGVGFDPIAQQPETLWDQSATDDILQGIWTGQDTWSPSDHSILTARYGYIGVGFQLIPRGGKDKPMIFLAAIPSYEETFYNAGPIDRPAKDFNVDLNYFKESWAGGDHEFKFGFEYKTSNWHTFSSYGNGVFIVDNYQTVIRGPLTSGFIYAIHYLDSKLNLKNASFYITDTFRKDRLTMNMGFRFDHQTGKNLPSTIPAVPGFEAFVGPFEYAGSDPGITFNDFAPRIGGTYDLTGDGKTLIRGNFARYYDAFDYNLLAFSNPTASYNGAIFSYQNHNGDRVITPDELTSDATYFAGLKAGGFDLQGFLNKRRYGEGLKNPYANEYLLGIERQIMQNLSVSLTYTHRDYRLTLDKLPFGVDANDYVPGGIFHADTSLGTFDVPYFVLPPSFQQDGTAIFTNIQDYKKSYDGFDIVVSKRMSQNFLLNGSLVIQRQRANNGGGDATGHVGLTTGAATGGAFFPFDPTNVPFSNGQPYTFNNLYSEWNFKLNGVYQLPRDITVGGSLGYRQGYPFVLAGTVFDRSLFKFFGTNRHLILLEPIGSRRFDNFFMLDLQFGKTFHVGEYGRMTFVADLFNVTNENTVFRRNNSVIALDFNTIVNHVTPRALRLGVRYSY